MAKYYWTKNEEDPPVYHDHDPCSEGEKIKPENREEGDTPPEDRRLCDICATL